MSKVIMEEPIVPDEGILHHAEGIDLMPANIELSAMEVSLVNIMSREIVLRNYLNEVKGKYDYVLIDCMPSLGMITVNALAAADSIIIPVQSHYLPAKGMSQLLQTINRVKKNINPNLKIDGALITMIDKRTNFAKEISSLLRDSYGDKLRIFKTEIPLPQIASIVSYAFLCPYPCANINAGGFRKLCTIGNALTEKGG